MEVSEKIAGRRRELRLWPDTYRSCCIAVVGVLLLKVCGFAVDSVPRFFLGDSASYIHTALTGWIPPDRSFVYGFVIRWVAIPEQSIDALIGVQVAMSLLATVLVLFAVRRIVGDGAPYLWLAIPLAVAPIQLAYERFVMTEAASGLVFAVLLYCAAAYIRRPAIVWFVLQALVVFFGVALRVSIVPNLLATAMLLPILATPRWSPLVAGSLCSWSFGKLFGHLAVSLGLTGFSLIGYQHFYAFVSGAPPAFHSRQGYFLLATASPLVEPADFSDPRLPIAIWASGGVDTKDPELRNAQMFHPEGMLPRMERVLGDTNLVDSEAKRVAFKAIANHPGRFAALGWHNVRPYCCWERLRDLVQIDLGDREIPEALSSVLRSQFGLEAMPAGRQSSAVAAYFAMALPWYQVLVFISLPIGVLAIFGAIRSPGGPLSRFTVLVATNLVVAFGVVVFLAPAPSVRYLHLVEVLVPLAIWLCALNYLQRKGSISKST